MRLDSSSLHSHQHLRRRPDDSESAHAHEVHVGRRVHVAQRAIHREGIGRDVRLEALREDRLIDIPRRDVLLDGAHAGFERLARLVGPHVRRRAVNLFRLRQPAFELALQKLNLCARKLVQRFEVLVRCYSRVGDDEDAVLHVIERQHRIEQHEPRIVFGPLFARPLRVRPCLIQDRLERRRGVVADDADGAARETRQAGNVRRPEFGHEPPRRLHERLVAFRGDAAPVDDGLAAACFQDEERVLAEERVSRHAFATLDALEQERIVGVFGDLEECRDRREQVSDDLFHDRYERTAARELHEFFESRLPHDSSGAGWPVRRVPAAAS